MKINYGIIVINPEEVVDEEIEILHFCGYENEPKQIDYESLRKELKEDKEFGLTEIADKLELLPAPQEIVEYYEKMRPKDE